MNPFACFLLVVYASCFLARPFILTSKILRNPDPLYRFTQDSQMTEVYTIPLVQTSGSAELKNTDPFKTSIIISDFNFKRLAVVKSKFAKFKFSLSSYSRLEWQKICINAP